ncbi:MAG: hypothetical protein AB1921_02115 [Thermodesulfobacteriota bacterium]
MGLLHRVKPAGIGLALLACLFFAPPGFCDCKNKIALGANVRETFDDNIFLSRTGKKSDWITLLAAPISLGLTAERGDLSLVYTPAQSLYADYNQNNTLRHNMDMTADATLTENLSFNFLTRYVRTEDPLGADLSDTDAAEDVIGLVAHHKATGEAKFTEKLGKRSSAYAGYGYATLIYDDPTTDSGLLQTPKAGTSLWISEQNGVELSYEYTDGRFWRKNRQPTQDDFISNEGGIKLLHRFSDSAKAGVSYNLLSLRFDNNPDDYNVHKVLALYSQTFSQEWSANLSAGYFQKDNRLAGDMSGPAYELLVTRTWDRGNLSLTANGGYELLYLASRQRGFHKFHEAGPELEYKLTQRITAHALVFYRYDEQENKVSFDVWRQRYWIRYSPVPKLNITAEYTNVNKSDEQPQYAFTDNRFSILISLDDILSYCW